MTPRNRNRMGLILIVVLFATPLVAAIVLHATDWRPTGTRNYGELIEPPLDVSRARFELADGTPLAWKDADWSWTVFALTGPGCAEKCIARIDELRRARLTLNQNSHRVRLIVLDASLSSQTWVALAPATVARDADSKLDDLRPLAVDEVAVAFADPQGFVVIRYAAGYDANKLRKDLAKLVKR